MTSTRTSALFCAALVAAAILVPSAPPAEAARCDTDAVPAATLLFPYFQVDLDRPNGRTTLLSISNSQAEPVLTNVVLWTDWAVPTVQLNVYLAGYDVQTLNLRDVLVHGRLPATGSAVSQHGALSGPPESFPGCNDTAQPGEAPVYPEPALDAEALEELTAWHTGECHQGERASFSGFEDAVARGYVTVDVVRRCAEATPADAGYFGAEGLAAHDNVLTGDAFLVDTGENFAQGELAVHVESFPGEFSSGDSTFYERYVEGSGIDFREPLGTQYTFRHLTGGAFDGGTRVVVWRDTGSSAAEPVPCDGAPAWWTPSPASGGLAGYRVYFDEQGNAQADPDLCDVNIPGGICFWASGQATQLVGMGRDRFPEFFPDFDFGRTYITTRELNGSPDPADWTILQGWVSVINSAEDRYSVGQRATRLDSACDPGPIDPAPGDFE